MAGPWEAFQSAPTSDPKVDGPWSQFHPETGEPMSWGDVAVSAAKNFGPSAINMAAGVANTVMHPIQTAESLYDVGKGAVSKAAGALGVEQDPEQKAQREAALNGVIDFFTDRYGGIDNLKHTIATDPAGFAMDLSSVLTGGETALARIPGATRAANAVGKAAEVTNPVNIAGKVVSGVPIPGTGLKAGIEPIVSTVLGQTTGVGEGPIRQAARAGFEGNTALRDNMRGNVPLSDTVDMAQRAVGQMRRDRSAAYQADMAGANSATGHVGYQPIHQALTDADNMVHFQGLAKSAEAAKTLEQIQDLVSQWRGLSTPHTVEAADALKQAIGEVRQKTQPGTLERRVADMVYHAAKDSIVQQAPEYAKAMQGYSDASDKINDLTKTFSLGEKASTDTSLRKLQSTTRNNVNTNYGERNRLLDELAKYEPELPNALAGQSLSSATPRGLVAKTGAVVGLGANGVAMHGLPALMNPATLAALPFFSPRLMGEVAYAGGRVANALEPIAQYIPDAVKAGYVVNALTPQVPSLRGGSGPRYDENGNLLPGQ